MGIVDTFLAHHGVIGMKWGIRKGRQSAGGSKSSGSGGKSSNADKRTSASKEAASIAKSKAKLDATDNKKLRSLLDRLNMERQLKEFTTPQKTRGQKIANKIIEASGKGLLSTYSRILGDVSYKYASDYMKKKGLS